MIVTKENDKYIREAVSNVLGVSLYDVATGSDVDTGELRILDPVGAVIDDMALLAEIGKIKDHEMAIQYRTDRKYPPIGDQLDALFHAGVFPQEMADKIQAVKDAHPKPTGE